MFDQSDANLLAELAKSHSVAQLADKWEVTYRQMYNFLYRKGIKAQKFVKVGRKTSRVNHKKLMAKISELALAGTPGKVIAIKVNRTPEYVSKVLQGLRISATAEKRRIMLNKYRNAKAIAARMAIPLRTVCLIEYGWSKYKTEYAAKLDKKAPNK